MRTGGMQFIHSGIKSALRIRRCFCSKKDGNPFLTDWHLIPTGESDVGERTRLSYLTGDMMENDLVGVATISRTGFRLFDGSFLYGPIAVFPKAVLSWRVISPDRITRESLEFFTLLEPKLDVLVVGVGDRANIDAVRGRITPFICKCRIGLEVLDTEEAIPTFNYLNYEGRYVAAALYPPDNLVVTDRQYTQSLHSMQDYDVLEENPFAYQASSDKAKIAIRKLWHGKKADEIERILEERYKDLETAMDKKRQGSKVDWKEIHKLKDK